MSGNRALPWGAGVPEVVRTGEFISGGDVGGRKGGRNDGEGERGGWRLEI